MFFWCTFWRGWCWCLSGSIQLFNHACTFIVNQETQHKKYMYIYSGIFECILSPITAKKSVLCIQRLRKIPTSLYCIVLYCIVWYCIVLYCIEKHIVSMWSVQLHSTLQYVSDVISGVLSWWQFSCPLLLGYCSVCEWLYISMCESESRQSIINTQTVTVLSQNISQDHPWCE